MGGGELGEGEVEEKVRGLGEEGGGKGRGELREGEVEGKGQGN